MNEKIVHAREGEREEEPATTIDLFQWQRSAEVVLLNAAVYRAV